MASSRRSRPRSCSVWTWRADAVGPRASSCCSLPQDVQKRCRTLRVSRVIARPQSGHVDENSRAGKRIAPPSRAPVMKFPRRPFPHVSAVMSIPLKQNGAADHGGYRRTYYQFDEAGVTLRGIQQDIVEVFPGSARTARAMPTAPHFFVHMIARVRIVEDQTASGVRIFISSRWSASSWMP